MQVKSTLVVFRPELLAERRGSETMIIAGSSRGGTSIVSYVFAAAGFYLGDRTQPQNHEDLDFREAHATRKLDALIARRNAEHVRWAVKMPLAVQFLGALEPRLRNPVFILVYRNPLRIGLSIINREPTFGKTPAGLLRGIEHGLRLMTWATQQAGRVSAPIALVEAEAAATRPRLFVSEVLGLLSDPEPKLVETIAASISKPGYKPLAKGGLPASAPKHHEAK